MYYPENKMAFGILNFFIGIQKRYCNIFLFWILRAIELQTWHPVSINKLSLLMLVELINLKKVTKERSMSSTQE